jgi:hypothetical protein
MVERDQNLRVIIIIKSLRRYKLTETGTERGYVGIRAKSR